MRRFLALFAAALLLTVGIGYAVNAQDQGTPTAEMLCATPLAESGAPPATVVPAPTTAADAGGSEPGTPIALVPCGTPTNPAGGESGTGDQGNAAANTAVTIEMVDIAFNPKEVTIPANTDVTITLPNNGVAVHNFHVDELGIQSEDVQGGGSTTVTINAPAGTYEFYCAVPGHREAGMTGTLTVQ
jgi:plastocyanin